MAKKKKFDVDGPGGLPIEDAGNGNHVYADCGRCGRMLCDCTPEERPDSWDNTVGEKEK